MLHLALLPIRPCMFMRRICGFRRRICAFYAKSSRLTPANAPPGTCPSPVAGADATCRKHGRNPSQARRLPVATDGGAFQGLGSTVSEPDFLSTFRYRPDRLQNACSALQNFRPVRSPGGNRRFWRHWKYKMSKRQIRCFFSYLRATILRHAPSIISECASKQTDLPPPTEQGQAAPGAASPTRRCGIVRKAS